MVNSNSVVWTKSPPPKSFAGKIVVLLLLAATPVFAAEISAPGDEGPPVWAYPVNAPDLKAPPDDGTLRHVPGSSLAYTLTQVRDLFSAPDWHPEEHPPLPEIVARGRKPDVFACGFCHRAEGTGGPENLSLAGLPAAYILQQMAEFKSGARTTSLPLRDPQRLMISLSKAVTTDEVAAAAAYFSALKPRSNIRVVETDLVPKTRITGWHLAVQPAGGNEPIGQRIIEAPVDLARFVSRDTHARFIAYVPRGSIEKGQALVATGGGGRTVQCVTCHGPELKGLGPVPGIAGRSPSYIFRQLYDIKHGARAGAGSVLMKPTVEKLTVDDMVALAAYVSSLPP